MQVWNNFKIGPVVNHVNITTYLLLQKYRLRTPTGVKLGLISTVLFLISGLFYLGWL